MVRLFQVQLEHYEKVEGEQLSLEGKANQLAQMVRANLPAAMQGFVVVPLFAGYDHRRRRGRVFSYDVTGGKYEEADFQANGSGGVHARNWIKAGWSEGLAADEAVALAIRSLFAAADEDAATGGPDLVRRHLSRWSAIIDTDGFRLLDDDDVAARSQELLGGPERGGNETREADRTEVRRREHALLRLARADDEGPRRLRAEGHRPRPQPGRAGVRRRAS